MYWEVKKKALIGNKSQCDAAYILVYGKNKSRKSLFIHWNSKR